MATNSNSNELVKFMNTATSNIQEALQRTNKSKKVVNHRKYIEKRLQPRSGPKTAKKTPRSSTSSSSSAMCNRQPVAGFPAPSSLLHAKLTHQKYLQLSQQNEYDQIYQMVSQPTAVPTVYPTTSANTVAYSRPPSAETTCDPEIESLLSELVDSPSQCSLYADSCSGGSSRGSMDAAMCSTNNLSMMENSLINPTDCFTLSPPSDFSDFDESNYSSPRNPSPVNAYYPNVSPSPPEMYYQHNLTATYDCIPTTSSFAVNTDRPSGLSLPYNPSITELMDLVGLVSTP